MGHPVIILNVICFEPKLKNWHNLLCPDPKHDNFMICVKTAASCNYLVRNHGFAGEEIDLQLAQAGL